MSYERPTGAGTPPGAEPPPALAAGGRSEFSPDGAPAAIRLQILSTEHWSLLASRSLAWNEAFSRAGMFLSTVAGAIVALALVAQASDFGEEFRQFALVILPVVLFVGIGTVLRMGEANYHDAVCIAGMNRIRAGYLEFAPELARFFVMGTNDDERGIAKTMAVDPQRSPAFHMVASAPMMISTLNSILFGAIVSLLAIQLGVTDLGALAIGAAAFAVGWSLHVLYARRAITRDRARLEPLFPTPPPSA
jgi:hypothetical protein